MSITFCCHLIHFVCSNLMERDRKWKLECYLWFSRYECTFELLVWVLIRTCQGMSHLEVRFSLFYSSNDRISNDKKKKQKECNFQNKNKKKKRTKGTYCPSKLLGAVTGHWWNKLVLLTSIIHSWTSGLVEPGVGYRIVRVSGNELLPPILCTAITAPVANHGYAIVPTCVSLNDANIMCVPSSEVQIASGVAKISSVKTTKIETNRNETKSK